MTVRATTREIDALCERSGFEWAIDLTCGSRCCWACTLTVILTPGRRGAPDRSLVSRSVAGATAEAALSRAWADMRAWLEESKIVIDPDGPVLIVPAGEPA